MTRTQYLAAALRLYLDAPGTPARAHRTDRCIAADLYQQSITLGHLAHAIRLATLRRRGGAHRGHARVYSLAYYRTVLEGLTDEELAPGYVDYVRRAYRQILRNQPHATKPRLYSQNAALTDRR